MNQRLIKILMFVIQLSIVKSSEDQVIEIGKNQFELMQRNTKRPKFGDCWKNSLSYLENGCKELTDDLQSRMSLRFANCFLAQSGQKTYPCEENEAVSNCLSSIDSNGFTAYSEFFTVCTKYFFTYNSD